jgi:ABC-2 type transport system ATP-binding protein
MAVNAIEIEGLTKRFGATTAVDGITLRVPKGAVYGFLGPNGSGKTTTLGMLTGLIPADAGSARIAGRDVASDPTEALRVVGALVEEPAFYPYLSGRRNLDLIARLTDAPRAAVEATLARVGLADAADKKYKGYSQGMKRRLGLAAALLPDPDVLILDEPANGLDPAGQQEVRAFLRDFAAAGKTVLVSSHILHDVQASCTHAAILRRGRVVVEGPMDTLLATGERIIVEVDDAPRALEALRPLAEVRSAQARDGKLLVDAAPDAAPIVNRRLVEAGIAVSGLSRERGGLEERFFAATGEGA